MTPISRRLLVTILAALLLVGCGQPKLADPRQIITDSLAAMSEVDSFHALLSVDGEISLTGRASMRVSDATLEGDFDISRRQAQMTFALPSLLGLVGELRLLNEVGFAKTSLTGSDWVRFPLEDKPAPTASASPAVSAAQFEELLNDGTISLQMNDDARCGDADCYSIDVTIANEAVPDNGALPSGLPFTEDFVVTLLIHQDSLLVAGASMELDMGTSGQLSLTATLSDYGVEVNVVEPDPSEVTDQFTGPAFPLDFPSLP